ncbi:MAG TPA: hypothetical protein VGM82_20685 [Gemmatimonadaceae bacterium]|jgi:hypothetical protein
MNEDRFEELMQDAAHTYRKPPTPDFDAMWTSIEATLDEKQVVSSIGTSESAPQLSITPIRARSASRITQRLAIAATLVIGIALGRASMSVSAPAAAPAAATTVATNDESNAPMPYEAETSKYLGQTAALLIALPSEVKAGRADEQFVNRAGELLGRTRLLIDSPAASDPRMRDLLEDLELVLAQVVRLQNDTTSRTELDLISRALEQRDVIPRLRTAVADISAN